MLQYKYIIFYREKRCLKGIHENIKKLRTEKNQTLEEVGKAIGTSKQTIQRYENKEILNIPYDKIELLAKHFNVSPAYLMDWQEQREEEFDSLAMQESEKDRELLAEIRKMDDDKLARLLSYAKFINSENK